MPLNNLNPYAHFRRWQQAAETSPDIQPGPALTGVQINAPWAHTYDATEDYDVVQALEDAARVIQSLIDKRGAVLAGREPGPPTDKLRECVRAAKYLGPPLQTRRRPLAQQLRVVPPVERVACHPPQIERDPVQLDSGDQRLRCACPMNSLVMCLVAEPVGAIEFHDPASLKLSLWRPRCLGLTRIQMPRPFALASPWKPKNW